MKLIFSETYPGSKSDSNVTEKNLIQLAGMRKTMKSCQIKGSLNRLCQKNNLVFRSWRSCQFWLLQKAFMLKDSLGVLVTGVYVINNDRPIQNTDQHQYTGIYATLSNT